VGSAGDRTVFRYEVPVDDGWHVLRLSGPILHVDTRRPSVVEVCALVGVESEADRAFRVFGTGQPLPPAADQHIGTAIPPGTGLVWHLWEHERPPFTAADGTVI